MMSCDGVMSNPSLSNSSCLTRGRGASPGLVQAKSPFPVVRHQHQREVHFVASSPPQPRRPRIHQPMFRVRPFREVNLRSTGIIARHTPMRTPQRTVCCREKIYGVVQRSQ